MPPPAVEIAADLLQLAVDAIEVPIDFGISAKRRDEGRRRQLRLAHAYARAIDWTAFECFWFEAGLEAERRHDVAAHQALRERDVTKGIPLQLKREVAVREGWRCRYCGIRVVSSATMTALERQLPAALPMSQTGHAEITCHAGQCVLRLTWDHITPLAAGGATNADNVVAACGACNFAKGSCTIDELGLEDPRLRLPVPTSDWGGLNGRLSTRLL